MSWLPLFDLLESVYFDARVIKKQNKAFQPLHSTGSSQVLQKTQTNATTKSEMDDERDTNRETMRGSGGRNSNSEFYSTSSWRRYSEDEDKLRQELKKTTQNIESSWRSSSFSGVVLKNERVNLDVFVTSPILIDLSVFGLWLEGCSGKISV